jgi:glycosyltransferase involved in cell wall biosynthesis
MPLHPTETDNGTTSILEAMAMGKAVICSRVRGQRDVIQEGVTGLFVPPQDPAALRKAIEYLWANPDLSRQMGLAARAYVERHHSLDEWVVNVRATVDAAVIEGAGTTDSEQAATM